MYETRRERMSAAEREAFVTPRRTIEAMAETFAEAFGVKRKRRKKTKR